MEAPEGDSPSKIIGQAAQEKDLNTVAYEEVFEEEVKSEQTSPQFGREKGKESLPVEVVEDNDKGGKEGSNSEEDYAENDFEEDIAEEL